MHLAFQDLDTLPIGSPQPLGRFPYFLRRSIGLGEGSAAVKSYEGSGARSGREIFWKKHKKMNSGPVRATHILFVHPAAPHPGGAAHRKNFEKNDRGQKLRPENQFSILFIPVALARPPVPGHVINSYRPVPHSMDQVDRGFIYVFGQLPGVRTKKTKKHPSCVTTPRSGLHISSYRYSVVSGPGRWFFTGELFFSGPGTGEDRKNKHNFHPALPPGVGPTHENGSLKELGEVNLEGIHRKNIS